MFAVLLVLIMGGVVFVAARRATPAGARGVVAIVLVAFVARLVFSLVTREIPFFSYGGGGDSSGYEAQARWIARLWSYDGIHYLTSVDVPSMGRTTFPANLFGLVFYLNGEDSPVGCTSIIAALACLTCLNILTLSIEFGSSLRTGRRLMTVLLFLPSFFFYSSDMYKDAIVQYCVVSVVGCALRLSRRFSPWRLAFAALCMIVLYGTRFYLVYAIVTPLTLGVLGLRSGAGSRLIVSVAAVSIATLVVGLSGFSKSFVDEANTTFEAGTSREMRGAEARGGSGVDLDTSSAGGFALALAYTLFAPFIWQSGSLGLQLGKIDAIVWYVLAYRAFGGALRTWRTSRSQLVILLSFIVPTTLAYAAAFANIGLTVRERLGVVMICGLLGALGADPQRVREQAPELGAAASKRWIRERMIARAR